MKTVFKSYPEDNAENDEIIETPPIIPRRVPNGDIHEEQFSQTMSVDMNMLTGDRTYKKANMASELKLYYRALHEDMIKERNLIEDSFQWWLKCGKGCYPTLFRVECDFLSVPYMSCGCECAISRAGRTVTLERNVLLGTTIEALQLQKNCLQTGVAESELRDLVATLKTLSQPAEQDVSAVVEV